MQSSSNSLLEDVRLKPLRKECVFWSIDEILGAARFS